MSADRASARIQHAISRGGDRPNHHARPTLSAPSLAIEHSSCAAFTTILPMAASSSVSSGAALSRPSYLSGAWELDEVVEVSVADRLPQLRHCAVGVVAR